MNRAQRRYRAARVHGSREYRQAAAYRAAEIHKCNQDCIVQTVERPAARRRIIADAVLFLANWHESRGARIEMFTAGECGIPMYFKADQLPRAED